MESIEKNSFEIVAMFVSVEKSPTFRVRKPFKSYDEIYTYLTNEVLNNNES